jgi:outer membrane protein assembly factor BamE
MPCLSRMILIFTLACTAGCETLRFPGVFRIDIPQGNIITHENVEKLKVGMTTRQVEFVMGTAMIRDPFHPERWDYFYHLETGKGEILTNHLILTFDGDTLTRIDKSRYKGDPALQQAVGKKLTEEGNFERTRKVLPTEADAIPSK